MLTPDQMKLRRTDNEIQKLRLENQRLVKQAAEVKEAFIPMLREMAKYANFSDRVMLRAMAADLENQD